VALARTEGAKRRKVFYYFSGGAEEIAGKHCHRYAFSCAASPYTAMQVVVENYMKLNPGHKKWYLFVENALAHRRANTGRTGRLRGVWTSAEPT
jgi:hypothetical protein